MRTPADTDAALARLRAAAQLLSVPATLVFYVPPHGLSAILSDMADVLGGQRQAVVARELTKLHEEFYRRVLCCCLSWRSSVLCCFASILDELADTCREWSSACASWLAALLASRLHMHAHAVRDRARAGARCQSALQSLVQAAGGTGWSRESWCCWCRAQTSRRCSRRRY